MSTSQEGASAHTLRITLLLNFYNVVPPHQKYFVFFFIILITFYISFYAYIHFIILFTFYYLSLYYSLTF